MKPKNVNKLEWAVVFILLIALLIGLLCAGCYTIPVISSVELKEHKEVVELEFKWIDTFKELTKEHREKLNIVEESELAKIDKWIEVTEKTEKEGEKNGR